RRRNDGAGRRVSEGNVRARFLPTRTANDFAADRESAIPAIPYVDTSDFISPDHFHFRRGVACSGRMVYPHSTMVGSRSIGRVHIAAARRDQIRTGRQTVKSIDAAIISHALRSKIPGPGVVRASVFIAHAYGSDSDPYDRFAR